MRLCCRALCFRIDVLLCVVFSIVVVYALHRFVIASISKNSLSLGILVSYNIGFSLARFFELPVELSVVMTKVNCQLVRVS